MLNLLELTSLFCQLSIVFTDPKIDLIFGNDSLMKSNFFFY